MMVALVVVVLHMILLAMLVVMVVAGVVVVVLMVDSQVDLVMFGVMARVLLRRISQFLLLHFDPVLQALMRTLRLPGRRSLWRRIEDGRPMLRLELPRRLRAAARSCRPQAALKRVLI